MARSSRGRRPRASRYGWKPDGIPRRVGRRRSGGVPAIAAVADIWRLGPNGELEDFLPSTLDDRNPQFSPDGSRVAFESRRLGRGSQLWLANANGTNPTPLTEGAEGVQGSPRWSSDSRRIVFDGQGPDGPFGIWVVDAVGGAKPERIADRGSLPSWSSRGEIYFNSNRTGLLEGWRLPSAGGRVEQVTHNGGVSLLESPDGTTLHFKKETDPGVLFAQPAGGGQERRVLESVTPGVNQYFPVEDGIYYISIPDPTLPFVRELRFFRLATGKYETLHRFEARTGHGLTVSKDRKTILYSGTKPSAGDDLMLIQNYR